MAQSLANPNLITGPTRRGAVPRAVFARLWRLSDGRPGIGRILAQAVALALASALTAWSAVAIKQGGRGPALLAVSSAAVVVHDPAETAGFADAPIEAARLAKAPGSELPVRASPGAAAIAAPASEPPIGDDPRRRWFNGRPIRPAHVVWMTVTAYTPGAESCWPSDDGETATLHCVTTNGGAMVAADTAVLPFGSLVSVAGYDASRVVPVLDRGGKIRGRRLDVLMETVEEARAWGVRRVPVVVWEYADGQGPTDPRRVR